MARQSTRTLEVMALNGTRLLTFGRAHARSNAATVIEKQRRTKQRRKCGTIQPGGLSMAYSAAGAVQCYFFGEAARRVITVRLKLI